MAAALEFAGNDVKIELGEDGHSNRHGASMLPETLRWLWRDYPQPIAVHRAAARRGPRHIRAARSAARSGRPASAAPRRRPLRAAAAPAAGRGGGPRGAVYALIYRDKLWEQVGGTYKSAASPAMDKDGNVFFADPASNRIYKSDAARAVTVFKEQHRRRAGASLRRGRPSVRDTAGRQAAGVVRSWRRREGRRAEYPGQRSRAHQERRDLLRRHGAEDRRLHRRRRDERPRRCTTAARS